MDVEKSWRILDQWLNSYGKSMINGKNHLPMIEMAVENHGKSLINLNQWRFDSMDKSSIHDVDGYGKFLGNGGFNGKIIYR